MSHKRYFISACLLGQKVRYDGKDCLVAKLVQALLDKNYVSLCPEVCAGLPTPRPAAEIRHGSGADVLFGQAQVFSSDGYPLSDAFIQGAYQALALAKPTMLPMPCSKPIAHPVVAMAFMMVHLQGKKLRVKESLPPYFVSTVYMWLLNNSF